MAAGPMELGPGRVKDPVRPREGLVPSPGEALGSHSHRYLARKAARILQRFSTVWGVQVLLRVLHRVPDPREEGGDEVQHRHSYGQIDTWIVSRDPTQDLHHCKHQPLLLELQE